MPFPTRIFRVLAGVCLAIALLIVAWRAPSSVRGLAQPAIQINSRRLCSLRGQSFPCPLIFDAHYYTSTYEDVEHMTPSQALVHWLRVGVLVGRNGHGGHRLMKVILRSKGDWPLLRSNVLYHSNMLGGENIYVLDSSTHPDAIAFLREAQQTLRVNVLFTHVDLNASFADINDVMQALKWSADFLIYIEPDEFLALDGGVNFTPVVDIQQIRDYLDDIPVHGISEYWTQYAIYALPNAQCELNEDPALTQTIFNWQMVHDVISFFPAWSFTQVDSSRSYARKPIFNNASIPSSRIILVKYQWRCYETYAENIRQALFSQKYFNQSNLPAQHLLECRTKWRNSTRDEVKAFCADLANSSKTRSSYLSKHSTSGNTVGGGAWTEITTVVENMRMRMTLPELSDTLIAVRNAFVDPSFPHHPANPSQAFWRHVEAHAISGKLRSGWGAIVMTLELSKLLLNDGKMYCNAAGKELRTKLRVVEPMMNPWTHKNYPHLNFTFAILACFLDPTEIQPDLHPSVTVVWNNTSYTSKPNEIVFPKYTPPKDRLPVVFLVAVLHDIPQLLPEWIDYHRKHYLNATFIYYVDTTSVDLGKILAAIPHNYKIIPWPKLLPVYGYGQHLALVDAVHRFRWLANWTFVLDSDDFLVSESPITQVADKLCALDSDCSSVSLLWVVYYPDCGLLPLSQGIADLPSRVRVRGTAKNWKSIHRFSRLYDVTPHSASSTKKLNIKEAFVAHIRAHVLPPDGCPNTTVRPLEDS